MSWSHEYASENAFWVALRTRASRQAKGGRLQSQEVLRQFVVDRFVARLFQETRAPWVVAGGSGMLIRIPGARTTRDLDLTTVHSVRGDRGSILADVAPHLGLSDLDPFGFSVVGDTPFTGVVPGIKLRVAASIGGARAAFFGLDVASGEVAVSDIEFLQPTPAVDGIRGLSPLPAVPLFPLASQIADKVVGVMYRDDRGRSAGRYRDLVDLALYAGRVDVEAGTLHRALQTRAHARDQPAPDRITIPGDWQRGYHRVAAETILPTASHDAQAAAEAVGAWLDPVLARRVPDDFRWDHGVGAWHDPSQPASRPGKVWVRSHMRSGQPVVDYFRSPPTGA